MNSTRFLTTLKSCRCSLLLTLFLTFAFLSNLARGASGDQHWDSQFGPVGVNGQLENMTVCGGKVYVAGFLTSAGNVTANLIAGFDGTNWFALNNGIAGNYATGLGTDGTNLYVGGSFTNADNSGAQENARWDGANWFPLAGNTLGGIGLVFDWHVTNLFVGGNFTTAGSNTVNNIARWDGANWWPLGAGVTNAAGLTEVFTLAFQGNNVYAGGQFTTAGGVSATNIAYYDGLNWHAMGNPFPTNGPVDSLLVYGTNLYAAGAFTNSSLRITNLAVWNGSSWSPGPGSPNAHTYALATDNTNLYVGGAFTQIGTNAADGVADWNGTNWSALGSGVLGLEGGLGAVYFLNWQSNQLYAAGAFSRAGNVGASQVARWDGANWWSLGGQASHGMSWNNGFVRALTTDDTNIYAGGFFAEAGDVEANGVAEWDGTNWSALGSGLTGSFQPGLGIGANALAFYQGYLYAGGNFTNAGGNPASGIAYWDGFNWNALDNGVDWVVQAMTVADGILYVGGSFTNADGLFSQGFAYWDGSYWYGASGGVSGGNGRVSALAGDTNSGMVYAGGDFTLAGGSPATNIAAWNGSWLPLGSGLNGSVAALAVATNGMLYAGGLFTAAGSVALNHIGSWNGTTWSPLGSGLAGLGATVSAIISQGTNLFVTGVFTNAGGVLASNIAYWDGAKWWPLGSGLSGSSQTAGSLTVLGNDVYVGGTAPFAGSKPAEYIARWNNQLNFYPPPVPYLTRATWHTNGQFSFRLNGTSGQQFIIQGSTNLKVWTPLLTNSATLFDFTDTTASNKPTRAYRAVVTP